MQELYTCDHVSGTFDTFLKDNANEILEIFNEMELQHDNYFALRESMRLEYTLLCKNQHLREVFSNSKKYLMQCMENLNDDSESITYEAVILLSVFIIMENRCESICCTIKKNVDNLIMFID